EEYEKRAARYWPLEVVEVREERSGRNADPERIRAAEGERLWERVPAGVETVALTRTGDALSSRELAAWLQQRALESHPGVAFLIGGAFGLSEGRRGRCSGTLRLSSMTLPIVLVCPVRAKRQYRAGTIVRNEPYHKGAGVDR